MARYSIRIKRSAITELESIPARADRQRIVSSISALAENPRPHGSLKLSGRELYRLRKGRYRILYSIEDRAAQKRLYQEEVTMSGLIRSPTERCLKC